MINKLKKEELVNNSNQPHNIKTPQINIKEKIKELTKELISDCISKGDFFPMFHIEDMLKVFNPNEIEFLKECIKRLEIQQTLSSRWIRNIGEKVEELELSEESRKRNQMLKPLPNKSKLKGK